MFMTINFYKNINLVRIAGINRFVVIEFKGNDTQISLVNNNDRVYRIISSPDLKKYSIEKSVLVSGNDPDNLDSALSKFCKDNLPENSYAICDLNRYRVKTVKVPLDNEDLTEWLEQNRSNFLPDGATSDQFTYSYEKLFSDDDFIYLLVCVSRIDYVNGLSETLTKNGLIPLALFPFAFSLHTNKQIREIPRLMLELTGDSLSYSYSDEKLSITTGHFHLTEDSSERFDLIRNHVYKLGMDYNLRKESGKKNPVEIILLSSKDDRELLKQIINEELFASISDEYNSLGDDSVIVISAINKLEKEYDNLVNLEEKDELGKRREIIEKNITTRITLSAGALLLIFLLLITMSEMFLAGSIQTSNDELVDYEAKQNLIEIGRTENNKLKNDYVVLTELKSRKIIFPGILKTLSEIIGDNCYLSDIKLRRETDTKIRMEIQGVAKDQKYVTSLLSNLELHDKYSDVALVNSVIVSSDRVKYNPGLYGSELITFKIVSSYNVD